MNHIHVTDMAGYAIAPDNIRDLAEQWYESRGKQADADWAELYAWVRFHYSTFVVRARECGVLLHEGRALCCVERALGWNTYADEDRERHDGARSFLCVALVHDARKAVSESAA